MRQGFPLEFRHGPTFRRDKKRFPTDGIVESRRAVLVFELREKVDLARCASTLGQQARSAALSAVHVYGACV